MARERMITRTITSTRAAVKCADLENNAIVELVYTETGKFDNDSALKVLKENHETDRIKILSIVSLEISEKLYGMSEKDFMENAMELPPR